MINQFTKKKKEKEVIVLRRFKVNKTFSLRELISPKKSKNA